MQVKIYINGQLYKTVEIEHPEKYNVSDLIKTVHSDRDAGLIPDHMIGEKMALTFSPVK